MAHRSPSEVRNDSAKAVAAGAREKGQPSGSAHRWTDDRRNRPGEDGTWRPGKTAAKRRGR